MRMLHLDYQAARPRSRLGLLALCVAAAVTAASLWEFARLRQEQALRDAELAMAQSRLERDRSARRDRSQGARSAEERAAAQGVVRRLRFPWQEMFGAFEASATDEIALIGIEPDSGKGVVKLEAEARTAKAMFNYVRRLQRTGFLEQVALQRHEVQAADPARPLRFLVVATWKSRD